HYNLGNTLNDLGRPDEAVAAFHEALKWKPDYLEAWSNLASTFKDQGRHEEARAAYRQGSAVAPTHPGLHSNLVYLLHYMAPPEDRAIAEEHIRWNRQFAAPEKRAMVSYANDRAPERRLRIAYISSDLRDHVVGRNLRPLFTARDREQFEVLCFSEVAKAD